MSLKDAQVVSSKFLQLKEKLDNQILINGRLYSAGKGNDYQDFTKEADIRTLIKMFGELCELLHELAIE